MVTNNFSLRRPLKYCHPPTKLFPFSSFYINKIIFSFSSNWLSSGSKMELHHIVSFSTALIAVILNCIMMFVITNFSSDKIGRYKYLLFSYVLNAACYSFTQFFILVVGYNTVIKGWVILELGCSGWRIHFPIYRNICP